MERVTLVQLLAGMVIAGRYRLCERIGRGSMAEVWSGRDEKVGRPVAVKVISELLAPSQQARRRFANEGQAIGRIHHPNVISMLGTGTLDDGRPFLVMEYHPGETLKRYLSGRPPLGPFSAVKLGQQLLDGIAAAHDQGIIHRDMKPGNILLARLGNGKRQIKILDFGVARIIDLTLDPDCRLTQLGSVLGSPQYMPMEVARGAPDVDIRADIFGLGAVLYHSLTGRPPFTGQSMGAIMRCIVAHEIPRLAEARPDVPAELVAVIERAMAHLPGDRFPTARAMREAIDRVPVAAPT